MNVRFGIERRVSERQKAIRSSRGVNGATVQLRNRDHFKQTISKKNEDLIKDKDYIFDEHRNRMATRNDDRS
jgi:hypothetical protein